MSVLPVWKCHKTVEAAKINRWCESNQEGGYRLYLEDAGVVESILVDQAYIDKHQPKAGGYYVKYADGYESFSPAGPFEGGYTREA